MKKRVLSLLILAAVLPGAAYAVETEPPSQSKPASELDEPVVTSPKYADFVWVVQERKKNRPFKEAVPINRMDSVQGSPS